jgi:hypothetical protein
MEKTDSEFKNRLQSYIQKSAYSMERSTRRKRFLEQSTIRYSGGYKQYVFNHMIMHGNISDMPTGSEPWLCDIVKIEFDRYFVSHFYGYKEYKYEIKRINSNTTNECVLMLSIIFNMNDVSDRLYINGNYIRF